MVKLALQRYVEQRDKWPRTGRHLLSQFDRDSVAVYQAYRPTIGQFAVDHGYFGGEFSFTRMSWIKPSFLWMMSRSAWGTKPEQEMVLSIRLKRSAFDEILQRATPADASGAIPPPEGDAKTTIPKPSVVFQWDPDHDPFGNELERRTIQLGLRADALRLYGQDWVVGIEDVTEFVGEGRRLIEEGDLSQLLTPVEEPYPVRNPQIALKLGLQLA